MTNIKSLDSESLNIIIEIVMNITNLHRDKNIFTRQDNF